MKGIGILGVVIVLTIMVAGCLNDEIRVTQGEMNESFDITFEEAQSGWRVLSNDTDFKAYISADMIDIERRAVPDLEIVLENGKKISTGDMMIDSGKDFSGQPCYFINSTDFVGRFDTSLSKISRSGVSLSSTTQAPFKGTMLIYPFDLEPEKLKGEETEAFFIVSGKFCDLRSEDMMRKMLMLLLISLSIIMMTGCTDKNNTAEDISSPAEKQPYNYPQEISVETPQGRIFEVSSPSGVSVGDKLDNPLKILEDSDNNWRFTGDDGIYFVEGLFNDLNNIPNILILTPTREEVSLTDFVATTETDNTGRQYQVLTWKQVGFKTISIDCLNEKRFRENWSIIGLYNGRADVTPVTILKVHLDEGEFWKIKISSELNS